MNTQQILDTLPLRTTRVSADPDTGPLHAVTLPVTWDDTAARALLDLSITPGQIAFADVVMPWLNAIVPENQIESRSLSTRRDFLDLLLRREAAPTAGFWQGHHDRQAGFVINIAAFCGQGSFDGPAYLTALRRICAALRDLHARHAHRINGELPLFDPAPSDATPIEDADMHITRHAGTVLLTNLDAALAALGFDYDSEDGRDSACYIAWLTTSVARQGTGPVPLPPVSCPIPALALIGEKIRDEIDLADAGVPLLPVIETGFSAPGPIDCILGVEACGFTPIFSPLTDDGALRESTIARLSHKGYTPATALAAAIAGQSPLTQLTISAHLAMHRALSGFVDRLPARPDPSLVLCPQARLERGQRRALPHRMNGVAKRTLIGGQRLYLRTGEYEDGGLGEVSISTSRGNSMVRGLLESFNHAVSIGLQYGVPLETFVDQFAYGRYGIGGTVEGETSTRYATSITDYVFRSLAEAYLGTSLPDAGPEMDQDDMSADDPFLPFSTDDKSDGAAVRSGAHRLRVV